MAGIDILELGRLMSVCDLHGRTNIQYINLHLYNTPSFIKKKKNVFASQNAKDKISVPSQVLLTIKSNIFSLKYSGLLILDI